MSEVIVRNSEIMKLCSKADPSPETAQFCAMKRQEAWRPQAPTNTARRLVLQQYMF